MAHTKTPEVNIEHLTRHAELLEMKVKDTAEDIDRQVEQLRKSVVRIQQQRADGFLITDVSLHSASTDVEKIREAQAKLTALLGEQQLVEWITTPSNKRDEDGFKHRHEVPKTGQFRLMSACTGCDKVQDKHMRS